MSADLRDCWEIKQCGRERGGNKTAEFGECPASKEKLGHTCWAIAGTFCGGKVQGTAAQKMKNCMICDVYKLYNRSSGSKKAEVCPDEKERYRALMQTRREEADR